MTNRLSLLVVLLIAAFVAGCSVDDSPRYVSAPLSACKAVLTGRQKVEESTVQQCVTYDTKMNCTIWMPQTYSTTYDETRVVCDWVEWR